jgi:catechol 2,3-dioxygenase-like lactoylglutathione lyase family enzyme
MSVQLNHTIVSCRDQQRSAAFLSGILGLPPATRFGHFLVVEADNGVSLDFAETSGAITVQHYAFLVGEEEFDAAFGRIRQQELPYWADPGRRQAGVINTRDGGRGVYFEDPTATCSSYSPAPMAAAPRAPADPSAPAEPPVSEALLM